MFRIVCYMIVCSIYVVLSCFSKGKKQDDVRLYKDCTDEIKWTILRNVTLQFEYETWPKTKTNRLE